MLSGRYEQCWRGSWWARRRQSGWLGWSRFRSRCQHTAAKAALGDLGRACGCARTHEHRRSDDPQNTHCFFSVSARPRTLLTVIQGDPEGTAVALRSCDRNSAAEHFTDPSPGVLPIGAIWECGGCVAQSDDAHGQDNFASTRAVRYGRTDRSALDAALATHSGSVTGRSGRVSVRGRGLGAASAPGGALNGSAGMRS